ncbi:hypothetical protein FQA39_LY05936 [Lamprigera yunnana]|nr:hypothetical protein FQA39_LY05936 [Lamprigera yunnana]
MPLDLVLTSSDPTLSTSHIITNSQSGAIINGEIPLTYIDNHYIERLNYLLHGPIELSNDDGMAWCGMLSQPEYINTINNTVSNYDVQAIIDNVSALSLQYTKIINELEVLNSKVEKIGTKDDIAESVIGAICSISKSYVPNAINVSKPIEIESDDTKLYDVPNYSDLPVKGLSSTRNNVVQLINDRPAFNSAIIPFSEIMMNLNDVINTFLNCVEKKADTTRYNDDYKKIKQNDLVKDEVTIDLNNSVLVHSINVLERYYVMHRLSTDVTTYSKTLIPAETTVYNLIKDHFYFGTTQRSKITFAHGFNCSTGLKIPLFGFFHLNDLYYSVDGFSFYEVHNMISRKSDLGTCSRQVGLVSIRYPFINSKHPGEDGISGGRYYRSVLVFDERDNCIGTVHFNNMESKDLVPATAVAEADQHSVDKKKNNRKGKVAKKLFGEHVLNPVVRPDIVVPINTYYAIELCNQTIDVLYNACKIPPAQEGDDPMNYDAQTLTWVTSLQLEAKVNPANRLRIEMGIEMPPSGVRTASKGPRNGYWYAELVLERVQQAVDAGIAIVSPYNPTDVRFNDQFPAEPLSFNFLGIVNFVEYVGQEIPSFASIVEGYCEFIGRIDKKLRGALATLEIEHGRRAIYNVAVSKLKHLEDASSVSRSKTENDPTKQYRKRNTLLLNSDCDEVSEQSSSEQTDDDASVTPILRRATPVLQKNVEVQESAGFCSSSFKPLSVSTPMARRQPISHAPTVSHVPSSGKSAYANSSVCLNFQENSGLIQELLIKVEKMDQNLKYFWLPYFNSKWELML